MKKTKKRIAVLTGGGDCPGLNAVIRAVAKKAILTQDMEIIGIEDGYLGLIENRCRALSYQDVSGILTLGGTILGTSNTANPYRHAVREGKEPVFRDVSAAAIGNLKKLGVVCLVCIGGDGTLAIAHRLQEDGVNVVGVPKTIDNDLRGTDVTFGFDSAVTVATEGIDRIHTTAQSHHRVMIVEVMGRTAGWLALHSGLAGGGDVILIPEIPYDIEVVAERVRERAQKGKRFSIIVVSEGAKPKGGEMVVERVVTDSHDPIRLGGVGAKLARDIEDACGLTTRYTILGHLQRGGTPTAFDRTLATRFGHHAMELVAAGRTGRMVCLKGQDITSVPIARAVATLKTVPPNHPLIKTARAVGTSFGV